MFNKKPNWRAARGLTSAFLAVTVVAAGNLHAQEDQELEAFFVTGSFIPTAGQIPLAPVAILDQSAIEASGVSSNILEVLRKTSPQFSGSGNLGQSNANIGSASTGGGSAISLRNTTTLVLVNGRRMAFSPISGSGGGQFVDVNQIPVSAVKAIEVYKDGASAIYGSDASSGVVNIILRDSYEAFEAGVRIAMSDNRGSWTERKVWAGTGFSNDRHSLAVSFEWSKADPLWQFQRPFSAETFGTVTFPGVVYDDDGNPFVLNPELNAPPLDSNAPMASLVADGIFIAVDELDLAFGTGDDGQYAFNLADFVTLLMSNERRTMALSYRHKFSDSWSFFSDILYSDQTTMSQINAQPVFGYTFDPDHPYNPSNEPLEALNRFVDFPRQNFYDTSSLRLLGGLKGDLTDSIQFEGALSWNESKQNYRNPGVLDTNALTRAVEADAAMGERPPINMFARRQAESAIQDSRFIGTAYSDFKSELVSVDARIVGPLFDMPVGELAFATGFEYREESLRGDADLFSRPPLQWTGATTIQPFSAQREIFGAFLELNAPLLDSSVIAGIHRLDLNAAIRYERYSDADNPFVSKVGFRLELIEDELVLRGTWGESFVAPSLFDMFGPSTQGFTPGLSLVQLGTDEAARWGQGQARTFSNEDLEARESKSWTLGVVYSPRALEGLSLEMTYWNISETNLPAVIPSSVILQDVEDLGPQSVYADRVRIGGFDGSPVTAAGEIFPQTPRNVYVNNFIENFASQSLNGFDFSLRYFRDLEDSGEFEFSTVFTYFNSFKVEIDPSSGVEQTAGRASVLNGTIPRWRSYSAARYSWNDFVFSAGLSVIPSMPYEDAPAGQKMASYYNVDLSLGYNFNRNWGQVLEGLRVRLGVNNVTNRMPPLAPELFSNSNVDDATYNPIGRLFFLEAAYRF